jgi:hypothetical protein
VPTIARDGVGDGGNTYLFVIVAVVVENTLFAENGIGLSFDHIDGTLLSKSGQDREMNLKDAFMIF